MPNRPTQLDERVLTFLPRLWAVAPEFATYAGAEGWDDQLPDPHPDAIERRAEVYTALLDEARAAAAELGTGRHDVESFEARLALWRYSALELRNWERNPDALSGLGGLLFHMLLRQRTDADRHFSNLAARCRAVPGYLEAFRARLLQPDRLWVDTALRISRSMGPLFDALVPSGKEAGASPSTLEQLSEAGRTAKAAADDHRRWLEALTDAETSEGQWLLSDQSYGRLLELKQLELSIDEVDAIGQEQLELRLSQRNRLEPPQDDPPSSFGGAMEGVRKIVAESRAFLSQGEFATFPEGEELVVRETPSFLRPIIPFAALLSAGILDEVQRSVYLVSEPADGDLSELRAARIGGVAVHEGYPGHHLQLSASNRRSSLLRARIVGSLGAGGEAALGTDLVEGWAHYCEEQMQHLGFGCLPGADWVLRNDQVWRAVRILVDVRMCRGLMSPEEAVGMLVEHAGLSRPSAEAEVRRYTSNPTYQLCYLIGKEKLEQLKKDLLRDWQDEGSERRFHDLVLEAGCIPVEMLRRFEQEERENPEGSC